MYIYKRKEALDYSDGKLGTLKQLNKYTDLHEW